MGDKEFWLMVRAAKIRQMKLLEQERSCIAEEVAAIERRFEIAPKDNVRQVRTTETDSFASAMLEGRV